LIRVNVLWINAEALAETHLELEFSVLEAMAGGADKRSKHTSGSLQVYSRPDEALQLTLPDQGAQVVGRSIELVFGDGQEEAGGSGSGMRAGPVAQRAVRFRIWPSQQVMRELPEGGVGGKRTRSGRRREEGETVAFITSSGSQAT
jgi:hypothetical protein